MSFSKLVFLDRNLIIEMEKYNSGEEYSKEIIDLVKEHDTGDVKITALLSVMEGARGPVVDIESIKSDIVREIDVISKFLENAATDAMQLRNMEQNFALAIVDHRNNQEQEELKSMVKLRAFLGKENALKDARKMLDELDALRKSEKNFWGMATLCGVASITGNLAARGILKLNQQTSPEIEYNAYSDLKKISLLAKLKANILASYKKANKNFPEIIFLTSDAALSEFFNAVEFSEVEDVKNNDVTETRLKVNLDPLIAASPFASGSRRMRETIVSTFSDGLGS